MSSTIRERRAQEYDLISKDASKYEDYVKLRFTAINSKISENIFGWLCLSLFELIIYYNYVNSNKVLTKCDIERSLNGYVEKEDVGLAKAILTVVYDTRNNFAHSNRDFHQSVLDAQECFLFVNSLTKMQDILKCLMPGGYPDYLNSIYFIVKRESENPDYIELKQTLTNKLKQGNVSINNVCAQNYGVIESIRNQALLEVLGNYGLTDEEKQET